MLTPFNLTYCGKNKNMIIDFKYGFTYKNLNFGWHKKELYRLPSFSKFRNYPLKKLNKIKINSKEGYRISRDRKTIEQIKELTEVINYTYVVNGFNNEHTPF